MRGVCPLLLLTLTLAGPPVAAAEPTASSPSPGFAERAGAWLDAFAERTGAELPSLDEVLTDPLAPPLSLPGLYGQPLDLAAYRGRVAVVSFVDRKSSADAMRWADELPGEWLGDPRLVFLNVVFPGGISFLVPRPAVVDRLRDEIAATMADYAAGLPPDLRRRFDATEIRWAADWKRRTSGDWGVVRHELNVFVVDGQGRLRERMHGATEATRELLRRTLTVLLRETSASPATGGTP